MGELISNLTAVFDDLGRLSPPVEPNNELIIKAYNNEEEVRRVTNRRPRTDLMVKGLRNSPFEQAGLIAMAAKRAVSSDAKPFFERCIDIGIPSGEWWQGTARWELIVEVENNFAELLGTLADLQNIQAKRKWAFFYHPDLAQASKELLEAVRVGRRAFDAAELEESPHTRYELVVLPDTLDDREGFRNLPGIELTFRASDKDNALRVQPVTILEVRED